MKCRLTVCILAHNEEEKLKKLLPTLKFADEIIVVDDCSTDGTIEVCQRFGVKLWQRALNNDFGKQRNFALKQAKKGFVLFIDPDERVSQELVREITKVIQTGEKDGYYLKRQDIFKGKKLTYGEPGRVKLLRLGRKGAGWWERPVHETWRIKRVGNLKEKLIHEAHESVREFSQGVDWYSGLEAAYRLRQNIPWSLWQTVVYPPIKFILNYFIFRGFLDGYAGLVYAFLMSKHSFLVRWKLYKLNYPYPKKKPGLSAVGG